MENSFRTDMKMIWRGAGQVRKLAPGLLEVKILQLFFSAGLPFLNLWLTAMLLDEITGVCRVRFLIGYAALIVIADFAVSLICNGLAITISRKEYAFSLRYDVQLSLRGLSLDYERIEDNSTHMLLEKIYAGRNLHNYGLTKIAEVLPTLFYHIFRVCFAIAMAAGIFFMGETSFNGLREFLASKPFGWIILAFTLVTVLTASHSTNALSLKIKAVMNGFTYLNRAFNYYLQQYMNGYHAGKDIRLYRQERLIDRELAGLGKSACESTRGRTRIDAHYSCINAFFSGVLVGLVNIFVCAKAIAGQVGVGSVLKSADAVNQMIDAASEVCM